MCGISGILNFSTSLVDYKMLRRMNDTIAHRGPDGEGFWLDGPVGFGHRRLAIRGLGDVGHQPMHDNTGAICVTYNGEIYNYDELRNRLETKFDIVFKSKCDTEIIPNGWLVWGENYLIMLRVCMLLQFGTQNQHFNTSSRWNWGKTAILWR